MTKLFVSRTTGTTLGFGDQLTDGLELCVLAISPECFESLQLIERQVLDLKALNQSLDEVAFSLAALWFDGQGVRCIDDRSEGLLDNGGVVIEAGLSQLFQGLTPRRTEYDRVVVQPLKAGDACMFYQKDERFCVFTPSCYAQHGNVQVQADSFHLRTLDRSILFLS